MKTVECPSSLEQKLKKLDTLWMKDDQTISLTKLEWAYLRHALLDGVEFRPEAEPGHRSINMFRHQSEEVSLHLTDVIWKDGKPVGGFVTNGCWKWRVENGQEHCYTVDGELVDSHELTDWRWEAVPEPEPNLTDLNWGDDDDIPF